MPTLKPIDAIERLFALYEQQMYRIAFAVVKDEGQAEDAVMTAFERVVRHQGVPCDPDSAHAKNLMTAMARQCAIDIYRKNARERERFVHVAGDAAGFAVGADGPEGQVLAAAGIASREGNVARSAVAAEEGVDASADEMLAALPAPYREVLRDRFVEEHSTREIAEHLGISEANVRKRQQRGLDLLRRKKNGGEFNEPLYCQ